MHRYESCSWIELAADTPGGRMVRGRFVRAEDAEALSAWRRKHGNTDIYASVCRFRGPRREGTAVCPFFLEIDAEGDLERAREQALRACDLLRERLDIDPDGIELFFSGATGFYVVVPLRAFGNPGNPVPVGMWRELARRLRQEGVCHADLAVYENNRLLRLANSIHGKTGLYAVPVEYKELLDLDVRYVLELARRPRDCDSMAVPTESPKAVAWLAKAVAWYAAHRPRSQTSRQAGAGEGWRSPPCVRRVEASVLPDGMRHRTSCATARFHAATGMTIPEAVDHLQELNRRSPIRDPGDIPRLVHNAWSRGDPASCPQEVLRLYCDRGRCFVGRPYESEVSS